MQATIANTCTFEALRARIDATAETCWDETIPMADSAQAMGIKWSPITKRQALGNITGAVTVDFVSGAQVEGTLTGAVTFTLNNPVAGTTYLFLLTQDVTGGRVVTWPAAVEWPNDTAPTPVTTLSTTNLYVAYYNGTKFVMQHPTNYTL